MKDSQDSRNVTTTWTPWGPQPVFTFRRAVVESALKRAMAKANLQSRPSKVKPEVRPN